MEMKERRISIFQGDEEQHYTLQSERTLIGRDKSCDIVLNHPSISRQHAVLIFRYDQIYIENLSSTGALLKNGQEVEYAELPEQQDIQIGPYTLHWHWAEASSQEAPVEDSPEIPEEAESADFVPQEENPEIMPIASDASAPAFAVQNIENAEAPPEIVEAEAAPSQDFAVITSGEKTQVSPAAAIGLLKITKGETLGREIRLDNGLSWIVGRSAKCHIQIDNSKLSRQHFKIIKIGSAYRVEDLGSANGTRVNGVAVTDAPLHAFDTIQAGPVEVQFLVASAQASPGISAQAPAPLPAPPGAHPSHAPALLALGEESSEDAVEKTLFAAPVVYTGGGQEAGSAPESPQTPSSSEAASTFSASAQEPQSLADKAKARIEVLRLWYADQPRKKKIFYASSIALLLLLVLLSASDTPNSEPKIAVIPPTESERAPASAKPLQQANAAVSPDISPEFSLLPATQQNQIHELYAKAEQARKDKDWKTAFDAASKILKSVKRYKRTNEILDEAQIYLNEDYIGSISRSLNNVEEAAKENEERLKLLLKSGEKALAEKRWDDAKETFSKAMNLDPNSEEAAQGFAAAEAHNTQIKVEIPKTPVIDPEEEKRRAERDEIDGLKKQFQEARSRLNDGKFREGLPILKNLDLKLEDRLADYSSGRRGPASFRDSFSSEVRQLQTRVREGIDAAKSQLRAEYQTQLSDAEQFENNRQYIQAREIYDRILRVEPAFDEAAEARAKLYTKILAEARSIYQESLIYESVGDLPNAVDGYQKTRDLLTNVDNRLATEYYTRATKKLKRLER